MRILHVCLSCFYIDQFSYQENILPRQNKSDGHDVLIIASTETYVDGQKTYLPPSKYINEDGVPVVRIPYRRIFPRFVMKKLRMHPGVFNLIDSFKPDVILFHGLCGWELITVAHYKKRNPSVKFYADSHEDFMNSAKGYISKSFLHRLYYKAILKHALPYIDKIFYISLDTKVFVEELYEVSSKDMEFFPLGGMVYSDKIYEERRDKIRKKLILSEKDVLIVQAGKFEKRKKVIESIKAFQKFHTDQLKLVLIGSVNDEIRKEFDQHLAITRNVFYLGWKESEELMDFLCAADVYLQPGSQSAIMQNALCLRCPVILNDVLSHKPFVRGNGWLLNSSVSILGVLEEIASNPKQLKQMSMVSLEIAKRLLDYKKMAKRLYE